MFGQGILPVVIRNEKAENILGMMGPKIGSAKIFWAWAFHQFTDRHLILTPARANHVSKADLKRVNI